MQFPKVTKTVIKWTGVRFQFKEVGDGIYSKEVFETLPVYTPDSKTAERDAKKMLGQCDSYKREEVLVSMDFENFVKFGIETEVPENRKKQ